MADEFKVLWQTTDECDTTNLVSGMAAGDVWASDKITNGNPACTRVRVSYKLTFDASVAVGDVVAFYLFPIAASGGLVPDELDAGATDQLETVAAGTPDELAAAAVGPWHSHTLVNAGAQTITGVSDSIEWDAPEFCVGIKLTSDAGAVDADATNEMNVHRGVTQYQSA